MANYDDAGRELVRFSPAFRSGELQVPPGLTMLHSLTGFLDAGAAGALAVNEMLTELPSTVVAEFDLDVLYDYRARRPRMTFLTDHYGQMEMPQLQVLLMKDTVGDPFLLLTGPEPDFRWQAFAASVTQVARVLQPELVVGMHAIPWPAPHTRPVQLTRHSATRSLVGDQVPMVGDIEVPGHVAGLLEITLAEAGFTTMGFAAHVPHYVSATEYPPAGHALLHAVEQATGLVLPATLELRASEAAAEIDSQVGQSGELSEILNVLEQQYDQRVMQVEVDADDIAAQVEQFLADREEQGDA